MLIYIPKKGYIDETTFKLNNRHIVEKPHRITDCEKEYIRQSHSNYNRDLYGPVKDFRFEKPEY
jgi:hypothetical protein